MKDNLNNSTAYTARITEESTIVRFQNLNSKQYLWASGTAGAPVAQNNLAEDDSLKWILEYNQSDDTFVIRPKSSPECYMLADNGEQGCYIKIWPLESPTKWKFEYDEEYDAHRIVCEHSNYTKGVAVLNASTTPSERVVLWDKMIGGTNDRWLIEFL